MKDANPSEFRIANFLTKTTFYALSNVGNKVLLLELLLPKDSTLQGWDRIFSHPNFIRHMVCKKVSFQAQNFILFHIEMIMYGNQLWKPICKLKSQRNSKRKIYFFKCKYIYLLFEIVSITESIFLEVVVHVYFSHSCQHNFHSNLGC